MSNIEALYKEKIEKNDVAFFSSKIKEYKSKKINHLSILGYTLYNGSYEIIELILKNNGLIISNNLIEEDGFNTFFYLLDRKCKLEEKIKITELFKQYCHLDFSFPDSQHNFIGFCIAKNNIELLLYIYQTDKNLKTNIEELLMFEEDIVNNPFITQKSLTIFDEIKQSYLH